MQTQQGGPQPPEAQRQKQEGFPWGRFIFVALTLMFIAVIATLLIYVNVGAAILFSIITILGLLFAFFQVIPSLLPSKKSEPPAPLQPIIIHAPQPQPTPPLALPTETSVDRGRTISDPPAHAEKTQPAVFTQSPVPDRISPIWNTLPS